MWHNQNGGYYIGMWNKDLVRLLLVKDLLKELGFNFKIRKHKEKYYSLCLSTGKGREGGWKSGEKKTACVEFANVINPCIKKLSYIAITPDNPNGKNNGGLSNG
jgi:hypothetical protein